MEQTEPKRSNIWLPTLLALVLIAGMFLGVKFYDSFHGKKTIKIVGDPNYDKFEDVLNYIDIKYVDSVDKAQLQEEAINEMLQQLDPHSNYIPASQLRAVNESLEGNFDGIGIEFNIINDTVIVVSPISGGPSESLGILSGDKILKIEGENIASVGITNAEVIKRLRGPKGTTVNISIKRFGQPELLDFDIKRDKIPLYSVDVSYLMDEHTGYIKISRFSAQTYEEFIAGLQKLAQQGMKDLIIDLRNNPGGYLNAAVEIVDELLDEKKLIVYTQGRTSTRNSYYTRRSGYFEQGKLVILIDEGSASASEILAGAIQDWDRGSVVGRRSFGKGLVQEQYTLEDSSALRLTVSRYYTPTGRCIQKPYENGSEDYYNELYNRSRSGEFIHEDSIPIDDSLTFKTPGGKVVYGGGGIMPDYFVPVDTAGNSQYLRSVFNKGLFRRFVYQYYSNHTDEFNRFNTIQQFKRKFSVHDKLLSSFGQMAEQEGVAMNTPQFERSRKIIASRIKALFARQIWHDEGYFRIMHEQDNTVQKAYSLINGDRQAYRIK